MHANSAGHLANAWLAGAGGAAVFYSSAASDCTFLPNCIVNISQSTFINNTAADAGAVATLADSVQASLTNNIFANNSAQRQFGALGIERNHEGSTGTLSLHATGTILGNNTAGLAGALYTSASEVQLLNCSFYGNSASSDPGGDNYSASTLLPHMQAVKVLPYLSHICHI